jgi:hypothetical protein
MLLDAVAKLSTFATSRSQRPERYRCIASGKLVDHVVMTEELSRQALYNLVWAAPVKTLAQRFGISDVACERRANGHTFPCHQQVTGPRSQQAVEVAKGRSGCGRGRVFNCLARASSAPAAWVR